MQCHYKASPTKANLKYTDEERNLLDNLCAIGTMPIEKIACTGLVTDDGEFVRKCLACKARC